METRVCNKCGVEKTLCRENFEYDKKATKNHRTICRECRKESYRIAYQNKDNPRFIKKKESMRAYMKHKRTDTTFAEKEKVEKRLQKREKRKDPLYRKKENRRKYERRKQKMKTDLLYKLKTKLRNSIGKSLRRNGYTKNSKTYEILGCSYEEFKIHIESKWVDWMNWDNHGLCNGEENYGWDFDHIVPLSSAKCEEDIIKLNHHTNIQPLCSYINRFVKRDNIDYYENQKG